MDDQQLADLLTGLTNMATGLTNSATAIQAASTAAQNAATQAANSAAASAAAHDPAAGPGRGTQRLLPLTSTDPAEWIAWRNNFEAACLMQGWTDVQARNQLHYSMQGDANMLVNHINPFVNNPATADAWTKGELLAAYDALFLPEAGSHLARAEFKVAKQKAGEPIGKWHGRLRTLFLRANPGEPTETNRDLREGFLLGLSDPEIKRQALGDSPATYAAALERAMQRAAVAKLIQGQSQGENKGHGLYSMDSLSTEDGQGQLQAVRRKPPAHVNDGKCFLCNQPGHIRADCWKNRSGSSSSSRSRGSGRNAKGRFTRGGRGRRGRQGFRYQINALAENLASLTSALGQETTSIMEEGN